MVTIRDIAARVQTSAATVSRVINNDPTFSVSEETKTRIFQAAKELNYKPKRIMRSDIENQMSTKKIAILSVVPEEEEKVDVTWGTIRSNVEKQCETFGIKISKVLYRTNVDVNDLKNLDGLFVLGTFDFEQIIESTSESTNIIFVNNTIDHPSFDMVSIDFKNTIETVVDHFINNGHTKIGMIGGVHHLDRINEFDQLIEIEDPLTAHFISYVQSKGIYNPSFVKQAHWNAHTGYDKMIEILDQSELPTACFIASDPMAMGALRALQEKKFKIPRDMSIVGFDDMEVTAYLNPPLSTFNIFPEQIGKTAAQLMYERLNGRKARIHSIIGTELNYRLSCCDEHPTT